MSLKRYELKKCEKLKLLDLWHRKKKPKEDNLKSKLVYEKLLKVVHKDAKMVSSVQWQAYFQSEFCYNKIENLLETAWAVSKSRLTCSKALTFPPFSGTLSIAPNIFNFGFFMVESPFLAVFPACQICLGLGRLTCSPTLGGRLFPPAGLSPRRNDRISVY